MEESHPKNPANEDDDADELRCLRDSTSVPADDPRCRHPSSACDFRELCDVIDAVRRKRRAEARDDRG